MTAFQRAELLSHGWHCKRSYNSRFDLSATRSTSCFLSGIFLAVDVCQLVHLSLQRFDSRPA